MKSLFVYAFCGVMLGAVAFVGKSEISAKEKKESPVDSLSIYRQQLNRARVDYAGKRQKIVETQFELLAVIEE